MKILNTIMATIAIVAATVTPAQARDSFRIGINIGGHDGYASHSIGTHRHAPAFRGYYGAPVVYYTPPVVYYTPAIRYDNFRSYGSYGRHITRDYHGRGESRRGGKYHNHRGDSHRYGRR